MTKWRMGVSVKMSDEEKRLLAKTAKAMGIKLSTFIRESALTAALGKGNEWITSTK